MFKLLFLFVLMILWEIVDVFGFFNLFECCIIIIWFLLLCVVDMIWGIVFVDVKVFLDLFGRLLGIFVWIVEGFMLLVVLNFLLEGIVIFIGGVLVFLKFYKFLLLFYGFVDVLDKILYLIKKFFLFLLDDFLFVEIILKI